MNFTSEPHRCPKCHALVVDRRSAACTTCRAALPAEWIMTKEQTAKTMAIDKTSRAQYADSMKMLNSIKSSSEYPTI